MRSPVCPFAPAPGASPGAWEGRRSKVLSNETSAFSHSIDCHAFCRFCRSGDGHQSCRRRGSRTGSPAAAGGIARSAPGCCDVGVRHTSAMRVPRCDLLCRAPGYRPERGKGDDRRQCQMKARPARVPSPPMRDAVLAVRVPWHSPRASVVRGFGVGHVGCCTCDPHSPDRCNVTWLGSSALPAAVSGRPVAGVHSK